MNYLRFVIRKSAIDPNALSGTISRHLGIGLQ